MRRVAMRQDDELVKGAPGSEEALAAGCTCPVIDNNNGTGELKKRNGKSWITYWVSVDCPLHSHENLIKSEEKSE
jgi:hypothetical protein